MPLIDADAIYQWYRDAFDFSPNEVRFSMNDIRDNLYNIPTVDAVPRGLYESMMATCYKLQQALNEANNKGWIPCSERLPNKKGYYLVTRKNPRGHVTRVRFNPEQVERGVYNSPWGKGDCDVLAWMPLPEPYKGGDE